MVATVSGHPAAESYSDPRLASGTVPGTKGIRLTTMKAALPLFLDVARRANRKVAPLSARDTWSIGIRPPRAGSHSQTSDHAGWACDFWAAGIGAHTWPPRMNAKQARVMRRIVHSYKTRDGRRVFGWGAHESLGGDYTQTVNNDPMHVFVRPGITANDLAEVQRRMSIRDNGTRERSIATPVATAKVTRRSRVFGKPGDRSTRAGHRERGQTVHVVDSRKLGRAVWLQLRNGKWLRAKRTDWQ